MMMAAYRFPDSAAEFHIVRPRASYDQFKVGETW